MAIVKERIELGAERNELWRFVTDPDNFGRYVEGYASGRTLSENSAGIGARYEWSAVLGPLRLRALEQVTGWDEGRRVEYQGELANLEFHSSMELSDATGGIELEVALDIRPPLGPVGRVADPVLRRLVARDVRRSLARLRRRFPPPGAEQAELLALYRRRARRYDRMTRLYELMGFDLPKYRRMAADALGLRAGSKVVEIGCGTGANFSNLRGRVGPTGRVIGVDLTDAMLAQARGRIEKERWTNVELVQADAAGYEFPSGADAILSTLALSLSPDFDAVVERGARALAPGGRWVVLDLKLPDTWPSWLVRGALAVARPYGVELELADRHVWESLERHLPHTHVRDLFFGAAYLAVGSKT